MAERAVAAVLAVALAEEQTGAKAPRVDEAPAVRIAVLAQQVDGAPGWRTGDLPDRRAEVRWVVTSAVRARRNRAVAEWAGLAPGAAERDPAMRRVGWAD